MSSSPLQGVRILDFTWVLAGPYATRLLADADAEVIKVQSPKQSIAEDAFSRAYYAVWNRNKRGITLNMEHPDGIALAKRLVAASDVIVENFAPRVMENWGLHYDGLRDIKPDIIMAGLSLIGRRSPQRDWVGYGPTAHALSGMTYLTSNTGRAPSGPGFAFADHIAGLFAALRILAALEHRRQTGEGRYIDISGADCMRALLDGRLSPFGKEGVRGIFSSPAANTAGQSPNFSPKFAPHGVYRCLGQDRWCAISVTSAAEWRGFQEATGLPWTEHRSFASMPARLKHHTELDRLVEEWTAARTATAVMAALQSHGVPAGVVQDAREVACDPQLSSRGFFLSPGGPVNPTLEDASPIRLSGSPARYQRAAPEPGSDNNYVYGKLLGIGGDELARLRETGVI